MSTSLASTQTPNIADNNFGLGLFSRTSSSDSPPLESRTTEAEADAAQALRLKEAEALVKELHAENLAQKNEVGLFFQLSKSMQNPNYCKIDIETWTIGSPEKFKINFSFWR